MRTAFYCRVSTDEQSSENQLLQLREAYPGAVEYVDYVSGTKSGTNRAAFRKMMRDGEAKKFDLLVVWALDRLTREGVFATLSYLDQLTRYGICWKSYSESFFDSCGPFKDMVVSMVATFAKMERDRISLRTKAGLERVRKAGIRIGRPLTIDRAAIKRLAAQGKKQRDIVRMLGCARSTVWEVLKTQ